MVHRPFRLTEIMQVLTKYKLEPKRMQLVYSLLLDREPNMVLIEALKGGTPDYCGKTADRVREAGESIQRDILEMYDMI